MKLHHFTGVLPAAAFACIIGFAPLAMAQSAMAPSAPAASAPTTTSMPAPAASSTEKPIVKASVKSTAIKLPAADKFTTVAAATAHCPGDTVVWSSLSKGNSFHLASSKLYGKTKHGAYVCEKDALTAGFHASKK